jgi:serine/threonine protein kinase
VPRPPYASRAADVDRAGFVDDEPPRLDTMGIATRVGPYRVLRHLGQGGMGTLALAVKDGDVDPVVLKRPLADRLGGHALALARREALIASSLDHPGVVRVVDLVNDDGVPVLVMEHLLGLTLHEVGKRARRARLALPMEPLLDVVAQAARALHYVHTLRDDEGRPRGLVHRDIAPDNLFLTGDGTVKLLDFGVARGDDVEELTQFGSLKGKRGYFAPELVTGHPPDARTDLFALGVTLYWLLCGKLPWGARDPGPAYIAMMTAPPPPPSARNPFVPALVDDLALRLLAVDRGDRFADGASVAARVEELLARAPPSDRAAVQLVDLVGALPSPTMSSSSEPAGEPPAAAPAALLAAASAVVFATATRASGAASRTTTAAGADDDRDDDDRGDDDRGDDQRDDVGPAPTMTSRPVQRWDARGASGVDDEESRTNLMRRGGRAASTLQVVGVTRARSVQPTVTLARATAARSTGLPRSDPRGRDDVPAGPQAKGRPPPGAQRSPRAALVGALIGGVIVVVLFALVRAETEVVADDVAALRPAPAVPQEQAPPPETPTLPASSPPTDEPVVPASPTNEAVAPASPTAGPAAGLPPPSTKASTSSSTNPPPPLPTTPPTTSPPTPAPDPSPTPAPDPSPDPSPGATAQRPPRRAQLTDDVALRGPARIVWSVGGRTLRSGPGTVAVAAGTRRVVGFDPRRGVQSEVVIDDGTADWDALPRVPLLLRARPWANVWLGDDELGQTPLQPVRVVPGRYRVRFERDGVVVVRVVDVRAGSDAVKVNVDMAAAD